MRLHFPLTPLKLRQQWTLSEQLQDDKSATAAMLCSPAIRQHTAERHMQLPLTQMSNSYKYTIKSINSCNRILCRTPTRAQPKPRINKKRNNAKEQAQSLLTKSESIPYRQGQNENDTLTCSQILHRHRCTCIGSHTYTATHAISFIFHSLSMQLPFSLSALGPSFSSLEHSLRGNCNAFYKHNLNRETGWECTTRRYPSNQLAIS